MFIRFDCDCYACSEHLQITVRMTTRNIKLFHADYDNLTEWKINTATKYINLHLLEMHEKWPLLIN